MPIVVPGTALEVVAQEEIDRRRQARLSSRANSAARRGVRKKSKPKATDDAMTSDAEKLLSAEKRGLMAFVNTPPMNGMPDGGVGVTYGKAGEAAFRAYTKHDVVLDRLRAEGFLRAPSHAPHPWHQVKVSGWTSLADKVICSKLTSDQRAKIERSRASALVRRDGGIVDASDLKQGSADGSDIVDGPTCASAAS